MLKESELLNYIRQNAQTGIDSIKLVIDDVENKEFLSELNRQMDEYNEIYSQADSLLEEIGGEKEDAKAASRIAAHLSGRLKTFSGSISKIAENMIQVSTNSITKVIKFMNDYNGDRRALEIADKLRKFEENNVERYKAYL